MRTVDIPGGSAQMREKEDVRVRQRHLVESRAVAAAGALSKLPSDIADLKAFDISTSGLTADEASSLFDLQSATIVAALVSWSLPDPIPTLATIEDLSQELYDALSNATVAVGKGILNPADFDPPNPRSKGFQASPTTPSDGSAAVLRADQELQPTPLRPNGTQSTDSAELSQA